MSEDIFSLKLLLCSIFFLLVSHVFNFDGFMFSICIAFSGATFIGGMLAH